MTGDEPGVEIARVASLDAATFIGVLQRSGLAERRPVDDVPRIEAMLANAGIIVVARSGDGAVIGVSRAVTDFAYCCYLSDLAVDRAYQGRGIGRRLIEATRDAAGPQSMCLLLSAPGAMTYYPEIGMPKADNAFMFPRKSG